MYHNFPLIITFNINKLGLCYFFNKESRRPRSAFAFNTYKIGKMADCLCNPILLNAGLSLFENNVDPDQLTSD